MKSLPVPTHNIGANFTFAWTKEYTENKEFRIDLVVYLTGFVQEHRNPHLSALKIKLHCTSTPSTAKRFSAVIFPLYSDGMRIVPVPKLSPASVRTLQAPNGSRVMRIERLSLEHRRSSSYLTGSVSRRLSQRLPSTHMRMATKSISISSIIQSSLRD